MSIFSIITSWCPRITRVDFFKDIFYFCYYGNYRNQMYTKTQSNDVFL